MNKNINDKKLNKEQMKAVRYTKGPLLIIAGAGTGKTTVITERINWFISKKLATPAEILALTFTQKAALEMEDRVDKALPYGYTELWISTFHAFCEKVLRADALEIGLDPGFRMMSEAEAVIFLRKNIFRFDLDYYRPMGNPYKFIVSLLTHFARLKDEDIESGEYLRWAQVQSDKQGEKLDAEKYLELAQAYKKYEEMKEKEGVMDFADLISNTLKLFRTRKNVLKEYQKKYKYLLIDEFQDTNIAQNTIAILLTGEKKNITVVGDDDQAIYRWRGAAISNIVQFRKKFKNAKIIVLNKNYRSTEEILTTSYKLIQNNNPDRLEIKEKISKKLISARNETGEKIEFLYKNRVEDEAEEVIKKIKTLHEEKRWLWSDFAILVRANNHAEPFVHSLIRHGLPYQILGPSMLFKQKEVKDLIAYLKCLNNLTDSVAFFRVLSMSIFNMEMRELTFMMNFAEKLGLSLFEALEVVIAYEIDDQDHWSRKKNYRQYLPHLSQKTFELLSKIYRMIEKHLSLTKKNSAGQILYFFLEDTGLLQKITEYKSAYEEREALNISKFFDRIKSFETREEDASVKTVVDYLDMAMELGESPRSSEIDSREQDAVNILTVHQSKGLEFKAVFLVNLVAGRFPSRERKEKIPLPESLIKEILPEGDFHLQEERRLFYVAATRARDRLFFSASTFYGDGKRERKISPFVYETLGIDLLSSTSESVKQLSLLQYKKYPQVEEKKVFPPVNYLSYTRISTYLTCPLQYKYRYVLKIPVPISSAASFGSSIHLALQKFYEMVRARKKVTKKDLLNILDKVWLPVGYKNRAFEEKMYQRGEKMLTDYFDKFYQAKEIPLELEQLFTIRLDDKLKIGGKIDRVDDLGQGKIEIVDYKTGKMKSPKEIKDDLQMTVYAMAATDKGIYHKQIEEVILSFYFLGNQEKISSTRTKEQLDSAKERLIEIAREIEAGKFKAKVGTWCTFCDFRLICEAWQ